MSDDIFAAFPVLETARLMLREIVPADARTLLAYLADDLTTQHIELTPLTRLEEAQALITTWQANFADRRQIRWGLADKNDNSLLGTCGYDYWLPNQQQAFISYELARPVWGQGYMTEALTAILAFGFERMALRQVVAVVWPSNAPSIRLLERLGFVRGAAPTQSDQALRYTLTRPED